MVKIICQWSGWQAINLQNIQTTQAVQYKKKIKKWLENINRRFSTEDIQMAKKTDGQKVCEKMLSIADF